MNDSRDNWHPIRYAGVELPMPLRNGFVVRLEPIDDAERNAYFDLVMEVGAMKKVISVTWGLLRGEDEHLIMSTLENNRLGDFEYFDISYNHMHTVKAYWGTGVTSDMFMFNDNLELQAYSSKSVNFIWV